MNGLARGATNRGATTMDRPAPRLTRRFAVSLVGGAALALPVALDLREVAAGRSWCRTDPVIELRDPADRKGNNAAIYLSAALEEWELNNSSGDLVIEHPKDAKTNKQWEDKGGYFGQGISTNFAINEKLRFSPSAMDVRVRCYIPASRNDMQTSWSGRPVRSGGRQR